MIDFHCHLDLYQDPKNVVQKLVGKQVHVLAVTTTPLAWTGTIDLVRNVPRVHVALGLHPQLVASRYAEVDLLCSRIPHTDFIGEIGLDGSDEHKASLGLQEQVFARALAACATSGGRIISIHSRRATSAVLNMLEQHPSCGTPVLHWFSGKSSELDRAAALGCWFSVGPAMLGTKNGLRLASAMPRNRVLTETDGPFGTKNGMPLMPWHVHQAEKFLAKIWGLDVTEAADVLMSNFKHLTGSLLRNQIDRRLSDGASLR